MKLKIDKIFLNPELATYNDYKWFAALYKNHNSKNDIEEYIKKLDSFFDTLKHYSIRNTVIKFNVLITIYLLLDDKENLFKIVFKQENECRLMANIEKLKDKYNDKLLKY